tara:strand:+ start:512 stop:841 length:330 start_codon:yes stop_codon:yes gene_type:complete
LEKTVKKLSREKIISEKVINLVVMHQFNSANEALENNFTVELSGFGKFTFNIKKATTRLAKLSKFKDDYEKQIEEGVIKEPKREAWIKNKISTLTLTINSLQSKLNNEN